VSLIDINNLDALLVGVGIERTCSFLKR